MENRENDLIIVNTDFWRHAYKNKFSLTKDTISLKFLGGVLT